MTARTRTIWVVVGTLILGLLLYRLRTVLWPVFLALVLAYLFDPVIDKLEARKIPRTPGILILVFIVVAVTVLLFFLVAPSIQKELVTLTKHLPEYARQLTDKVMPYLQKVSNEQVPETFEEIMDTLTTYVAGLSPETLKPFATYAGKIIGNTALFLMSLINLILIPVFTFYFLRDFDLLKGRVAELVPIPYREWTFERFRQVDKVLGAFIRGQLTVCAILAVLYSLGLMIVGVDLALVIGVASGILFIVPYLGTAVGVVAGTIMALLEFHDIAHVLMVWGVFAVIQIFEGYVLTPRIVGSQVGMSPVAVILALLVAGGLFGFLGILIAVPVAAVLKIFFGEFIKWYQSSPVYIGEALNGAKAGEKEGQS